MTQETLLWLVDTGTLPDAALASCAAWLGEDERQRCARFVRAERRRQFIAGRVPLRHALGRLLGLAPREIALRERPGNAPALVTPGPGRLGFSISHSGPWVACAASTVSRLGLDIECMDASRDLPALADHSFGPDTAMQLRALEGQAGVSAFYRMWCLHEAHIKLGSPAAADHVFELPGLALALSADVALAAWPAPVLMPAAWLAESATGRAA